MSFDDELRGHLQNYEIFSQQQPHDVTYSIPLDENLSFQVTVAIVEKRSPRRFMDSFHVRKPSLAELQQGIARFASLPVRESSSHTQG